MQTLADMRGVGVKNREKYADVLCGRPLIDFEKSSKPKCHGSSMSLSYSAKLKTKQKKMGEKVS